jgi:toxin ParE1/3/4
VKALRLFPAAQRDLDTIWDYTAAAWGLEQAEAYIQTLHRDMERLRDYPELGPVHPSRIAAFRKLASGHHIIFYIVQGSAVEVVRVLHARMDVKRQLGGG